MRNIVFLLGSFFIVTLSTTAQTSTVDSLLLELRKAKSDTSKIRVLRALSTSFNAIDPDKKYFYTKEYLHLAKKNGIDSLIPAAYCDIAFAFGVKAQYDSTMYYFSKALKSGKKYNVNSQIARAYVGMGYVFDRLNNPMRAIENYKLALKIFKKLKHKKGLSQTYINLGSLYFDMREYRIADSYFRQVLTIREAEHDEVGLAHSYFNLGNTSRFLNKEDESFQYYTKSLALQTKFGNLNGIALANWGLGELYIKQKKYDKALLVLGIALENNRLIKNKYQETVVLGSLAETYIKLKNFKKAEEKGKLALENSISIKAKEISISALKLLIEISKENREYDKAREFESQVNAYTDSLDLEKIKNDFIYTDFQRMKTDNDTLEKSNEIILSKNLNYKKVIFTISTLLVIVLLLLFLYLRKMFQKHKINLVLEDQKTRIIAINLELEHLNEELRVQNELTTKQNKELEHINTVKNKFFSIISHDLRSPIATLKMMFNLYLDGDLSQDEMGELLKELEKTVFSTADFLDNLLIWSKSQLQGIVINAENFEVNPLVVEILGLLAPKIAEKGIIVENKIENSVAIFADKNMIDVLLRNLISNSIKFCNTGDSIILNVTTFADTIVISIRDTGIGMSDEEQKKIFQLEHAVTQGTSGEKGHHVGLVLCKDMVEQNNGEIWFESVTGVGTSFFIKLPKGKIESSVKLEKIFELS